MQEGLGLLVQPALTPFPSLSFLPQLPTAAPLFGAISLPKSGPQGLISTFIPGHPAPLAEAVGLLPPWAWLGGAFPGLDIPAGRAHCHQTDPGAGTRG